MSMLFCRSGRKDAMKADGNREYVYPTIVATPIVPLAPTATATTTSPYFCCCYYSYYYMLLL